MKRKTTLHYTTRSHLDSGVSLGADAADPLIVSVGMRRLDVGDEGGVSDGLDAAEEADVGVGRPRTAVRVPAHLPLDPAQIGTRV